MKDLRRLTAVGAVGAATAGTIGLLIATIDTEFFRYVSEAGIPSTPRAGLYRLSIWLLAAALALLSASASRTAWPATAAFALAAPLTALSGEVTCSPGCPLPPFERATTQDLVHAAAAITAIALCALAMIVYSVQRDDSPLRRAGRSGIAVAFPLLALTAAALAFVGRGLLVGVLERATLVAAAGWLITTAALHMRGRPVDRSP